MEKDQSKRLTASESKAQTENNLFKNCDSGLDVIYDYIKKHVEKGEYNCTILRVLSKNIVDSLKNDGYHVSAICDRSSGNYITTISWKLPEAPPIIEWPATTHSKGI